MKTAQIKDIQIAYHDEGNGAPILLVHAFPLNSAMWHPQIAELASHYRLIAPDLRGFGATTLGDVAVSLEQYADDLATLLDHLQLQQVALVGLSGGGKTTLVKLIPRFYEIQQGRVQVDGIDNRAYPLTVLRQNVSMVLQDSVLFEGTVAENIALGKPGAQLYEVIEAAKKANIHETIITTLGGYDGKIREQGKNLSGGQRQRMAIARAILRDAPILILDEPTAALDVESEAEVMHALEKLIVGRTVIMISHRLSTLGHVEEIIVLKNGQIAEQGSFQDLKRRGGIFAALLAEQNRYNQEKSAEKSMIRSAFVPLEVYDQRPSQQPRPVPAGSPPQVAQRWQMPSIPQLVLQPEQQQAQP